MGEETGAGSDDEGERKGGMKPRDIQVWLWEIAQVEPVEMVRNFDYPRYRQGDRKGQIVQDQPKEPKD